MASTRLAARLASLGAFCARRAREVIATWALVFAAAWLAADRLPDALVSGSGDVPDSVSLRVDDVLRREFTTPRTQLLVLAFRSATLERDGASVLTLVAALRDQLEGNAHVREVLTEEDIPHQRLLPAPGTGHLMIVSLKADNVRDAEIAVPQVRRAVVPLLESARLRHPDLEWAVTGRAALTHDLSRFNAEDTANAELRALAPTFLILVLAFGSLAATALPVLMGIASLTVTLGVVSLLAQLFVVSDVVSAMAGMIGLALGIDYSLFLVHRYRQEVLGGTSEGAVARAMETAGPVILYSGLAVVTGMIGLLATPLVELRSIGLGGCLVTAAAVSLALTLAPAILALVGGERLEWPRALSSRLHGRAQERWGRWAHWVTAHPFVAAMAGLALVLAIAAPGLQTRFGFPETRFFPRGLEYVRGMDMLASMGVAGLAAPLPIVLTDIAGGPALTEARVPALLAFAARLRRDACVSAVLGPIDFADSRYISTDQRRILLHAIPRACTYEEIKVLSRTIPSWVRVPGLEAEVGGQPQYYDDLERAIKSSYATSVGLVLAATCALLLAAFRSPMVALKAVMLNLASVMAGYGAVVYVFQLGHGSAWLGVPAPIGVTPISIPLLIFCILFGLSMDYEVFLLHRVFRIFLRTGDNTRSVRDALADTGPVITSAALIMVAVFGAFAVARVVFVQMIGLGLAVAVLVDATIIRCLLGPALMQLAGRWNWWPSAHLTPADESAGPETGPASDAYLKR